MEPSELLAAHQRHPRSFADFRYVYPVVSRRSGGLSIGLNLNPDKSCNFDCIYCQVDRTTPPTVTVFDLAVAERELRMMLELVRSGELARQPPFASVPPALLQLKDIALSGDGEPTLLENFSDTVAMIARCKPPDVKLVLITNATGLDRLDVGRGLQIMDQNNGEVWAKLDAGTEAYYQQINRSKIPFTRIVNNIIACARERPVVIQSLFLKIRGAGPSAEELAAYCQRLREIGNIRLVQVCTLARPAMAIVNGEPASGVVQALSNAELDAIAALVRAQTGLPAESFYGTAP